MDENVLINTEHGLTLPLLFTTWIVVLFAIIWLFPDEKNLWYKKKTIRLIGKYNNKKEKDKSTVMELAKILNTITLFFF